jgi:hypothetical protein
MPSARIRAVHAVSRVAEQRGPGDAGVVKHREHVRDVLAHPVRGQLRRAVAAAVAAVIHEQGPVPGQRFGVAGELPHAAVAAASGVQQDDGT